MGLVTTPRRLLPDVVRLTLVPRPSPATVGTATFPVVALGAAAPTCPPVAPMPTCRASRLTCHYVASPRREPAEKKCVSPFFSLLYMLECTSVPCLRPRADAARLLGRGPSTRPSDGLARPVVSFSMADARVASTPQLDGPVGLPTAAGRPPDGETVASQSPRPVKGAIVLLVSPYSPLLPVGTPPGPQGVPQGRARVAPPYMPYREVAETDLPVGDGRRGVRPPSPRPTRVVVAEGGRPPNVVASQPLQGRLPSVGRPPHLRLFLEPAGTSVVPRLAPIPDPRVGRPAP